MPTDTNKEKADIRKVLNFLQEWDRGNKTIRKRMLRAFLRENSGKTSEELELNFGQVACLFLARLTAWTSVTYMSGTCLGLQLKAIGIFLSAINNHQYLIQFLEIGGVLTLLEILGQTQIGEEEKADALYLLQTVSNAGRKCKELICECHGVKAVAECLARSNAEDTQEKAQNLLESLVQGNPKYQSQVYKGLIALLPCVSPTAQKLVLSTLRTAQAKVTAAHPSIVEPLLNMLRSLRFEVQDEAINLISDLRHYEVRSALLNGLVALLKPAKEAKQQHKILEEPGMANMTESLPVYVQQAAAAKAIRLVAQQCQDVSQELLSMSVVHHLMYAMGNLEHAESQKQAALALQHFVCTYPDVEEHVRSGMGSTLLDTFMDRAENMHMSTDEIQAEILLSNNVAITEGSSAHSC